MYIHVQTKCMYIRVQIPTVYVTPVTVSVFVPKFTPVTVTEFCPTYTTPVVLTPIKSCALTTDIVTAPAVRVALRRLLPHAGEREKTYTAPERY